MSPLYWGEPNEMGAARGPQNPGRTLGISHPPQGRAMKLMGLEECHPALLLCCLLN